MIGDMICPFCANQVPVTYSDFLVVIQECSHCHRQLHVKHNPNCEDPRCKMKTAKPPRKFRLIEGGKRD